MKTELGRKMKELLDNMSQEEFDKQWNAVLEYGFSGPTVEEFLAFKTSDFHVEYVMDDSFIEKTEVVPSSNYSLAA